MVENDPVHVGDSICCDGACLTIVSISANRFSLQVSAETVARTIVSSYVVGSRINLERALRMGDRLDGHLVSGHVDGVGKVDEVRPIGDSILLAVAHDSAFDQFVIEKGSIAVNGVSLTVNRTDSGRLTANLIPHTVSRTTLGSLSRGNQVNLEFDMIGKFVAKQTGGRRSSLSVQRLIESGW